jgi:hypothetical protein
VNTKGKKWLGVESKTEFSAVVNSDQFKVKERLQVTPNVRLQIRTVKPYDAQLTPVCKATMTRSHHEYNSMEEKPMLQQWIHC